jgi:hypothetical protein
MLLRTIALRAVSVLGLVLAAVATPSAQTLIAPASGWRYNDGGTNLGTAWTSPVYDDGGWLTGPAQLGYGDGDESTIVSYGGNATNRYITYYFRRTFTVASPTSIATLLARFVRDDGCVIYVNGVEVVRSNMPAGSVTYLTRASSAIGGADESAWIEASLDPSVLVAGPNTIAVEIHQQSPTSSDVSFDLELRATAAQAPAPTVTLVAPPNGGVSNSAAVTLTASASSLEGLASATVFVGSAPQAVVFSGPTQVEDAEITADSPATANGNGTSVNVDGQTPHAHGLLRFVSLIGSGSGQVPAGAVITSATLQLNCTNAGLAMRLYRLTEDWVEDEATWNQRRIGTTWASPGADGAGSNAGVALVGDCTTTGPRLVDLTRFVQEWADGAPNYGLVLTDSGTDGVDFASAESATSPALTVVHRANQSPVSTQALSGTSASVEFPVALAPGLSYAWNVQVTDALGRQSWAPADYQLTVDANSPNAPVLISPADASTDVDPSTPLAAFVSDPGGGTLAASVRLRQAAAPEFTLIALPDTQYYSQSFPQVFASQTQWIRDNRDARNIVFVTHEGDIVQNAGSDPEWQVANTHMSVLDGVVPYGMGPGNHDQPTTLYNQYFPYTRYVGQPWYGGHYQNLNDNNFQLFSGGGVDFVIVHLEFCPPTGAVAWADSVFKTFPDRIGIVTTHGYLNESAQRTVHGCTNTQYLWDNLAVLNPNIYFMLSGHVHDESRRSDVANGHPVFQMLADYQSRASGGEGWLRNLRFVPAEDRVYVQTYSPWLNRFESDANSEFTLDFPMGGVFAPVGTVMVPSDSAASVVAPGLLPSTRYEWQMTVTNASGGLQIGPVWSFTTGTSGPINRPPVANSQSLGVLEDAVAAITLSAADPDGDTLTYSIVNQPTYGALSGSGSSLSYQPAANYDGTDSFTFRANDGRADSTTATVSISIQAVNDPPSALGDAYTVVAGSTLTRSAPGVLGNDSDPDSASLAAELVSDVVNGVLALGADGSFSYSPTAGFSGADAFVYRVSDGAAASTAVTVSLTVTPAPPLPVLTADFNVGRNGFTYFDNTFRGATQPAYASGSRVATGGFTGGALRVFLGGIDNVAITGMSGGWSATFELSEASSLTLSLRYSLNQGAEYESDEISQVLAAIDGVLVRLPTGDYVAQLAGDGNGGAAIATGWQLDQLPLGTLAAGTHTLTLGGYNSRKTSASERTTILIDDVSLAAP